MVGASRRQVLMAMGAVPFLAGPPPVDGCVELTHKGRKIRLCPSGQEMHGLLNRSVFIDGVALEMMEQHGRFTSELNIYTSHRTLRGAALEAAELLRGARLVDRPPAPKVRLEQPDAGGRRRAAVLRKNAAALSAAERSALVDAFLRLKRTGAYDYFVDLHRRAFAEHGWNAHQHAGFLPWHRAMLVHFETQLGVPLPYWDWTVQQSGGATPFTPDFLGGNGRPGDQQVMDGPFAFRNGAWRLTVREDDREFLRREFGAGADRPSGAGLVSQAMAISLYDQAPYDASASAGFRNLVEGWPGGPVMHNRAHVWMGGSMLPASAPNDPAFFLNHCYVDKLWADWQARHGSVAHFLPAELLDVPMEPFANEVGWTVTPRELLDHGKWYTYGGAPAL
ncbi:tyrosinase family protein [Nonomuraea sp. NPDC050790]|uniref:tyrosinase family protein n=1 Tax=Nonomuraea sp. NPDC050790 TaxID=3364371 RepID=UPI00378C8A66